MGLAYPPEAIWLTFMCAFASVFYIFCNDEPLWMRLCLGTPSEKPMVYHGTWKQTALIR